MNQRDLVVARSTRPAWHRLIAAGLIITATSCGSTEDAALQSAATDADLVTRAEAVEPLDMPAADLDPEAPVEEDPTPVPANADAETILVAAIQSLGPTTDVAAEMARVGNPLAIATPGVVDVDTIFITQAEPYFEDGRSFDVVHAGFTVDMSAEEALAFFENEAISQGWTEFNRLDELDDEGRPTTLVEYELAATAPALAELATDPLGGTFGFRVIDAPEVRVHWVTRIFTPNDIPVRFTRAAESSSTFPHPEGGEFHQAVVANNILPERHVRFSVEYRYKEASAEELLAFYRDYSSDGGGYVVAEESSSMVTLVDADGRTLTATSSDGGTVGYSSLYLDFHLSDAGS